MNSINSQVSRKRYIYFPKKTEILSWETDKKIDRWETILSAAISYNWRCIVNDIYLTAPNN